MLGKNKMSPFIYILVFRQIEPFSSFSELSQAVISHLSLKKAKI